MVRVGLEICATLENVEKLTTCFPDYAFFLKLKCTNCGEISDKWHAVQESEYTHQDSRNPDGFNFYMKCKLCGRENTINVEPPSNGYYMHDDSGRFKMIVLFDCRGVEPVEFSPRVGWVVESVENGETFDCVDLSEGDWVDYDQKNNNSVGVYEFQSRFVKEKKK